MPMKPSKPSPGSRRITSVPVAKRTPIGTAKPKPAVRITKNEKMIAEQLSPKGMKKAAKNQSDALDKKYPGLYKKAAATSANKPKPKPKATKAGPMETTRVGGIISIPKKPKKTVY